MLKFLIVWGFLVSIISCQSGCNNFVSVQTQAQAEPPSTAPTQTKLCSSFVESSKKATNTTSKCPFATPTHEDVHNQFLCNLTFTTAFAACKSSPPKHTSTSTFVIVVSTSFTHFRTVPIYETTTVTSTSTLRTTQTSTLYEASTLTATPTSMNSQTATTYKPSTLANTLVKNTTSLSTSTGSIHPTCTPTFAFSNTTSLYCVSATNTVPPSIPTAMPTPLLNGSYSVCQVPGTPYSVIIQDILASEANEACGQSGGSLAFANTTSLPFIQNAIQCCLETTPSTRIWIQSWNGVNGYPAFAMSVTESLPLDDQPTANATQRLPALCMLLE